MKNAEILLLLATGLRPMDIHRDFHYPVSSVYNWYRIYREAGKALKNRIDYIKSLPPREKKTGNNLDV